MNRFDSGGRLGRRASFVLLAGANVLMMATASAPSPIYPLYRERWGFSVTMLTVIFAVYVAGLLGALLTVGSLSDHLGRRPVLVAALLLAATSTAIFWTAGGVGSLLTARVVQGLATGAATGALAAGLVEFAPEERPHLGTTLAAVGTGIGMAVGAGAIGLLVEVTRYPDAYVFPFLTLAFVSLAVAVLAIPEPHPRRAGALASLRPRVRVPREARPEFLASVPAIVAGWALAGLFLALTPSLVTTALHVGFGAAGGLSIAVLFVGNSAGGLWSVRHAPRVATSLGAGALALGSAGLAAALALTSATAFVIGSVVAGLGAGLAFNGTLRTISAATSAKARAGVFSAAYVVSYSALSVPSLAAGLLARWWGLETTAYLYIAFVAVLAVLAVVHAGRQSTRRRSADGRPANSAAGSRQHARTPC
ncbi:MFS transporter [Micromonospora sp. NPDC005367]|uniref:MFS transporter n=1 Tax=Micromonospora sp. NPDC005367 TaxID=3155590 RepID=UPI0033AC7E0D